MKCCFKCAEYVSHEGIRVRYLRFDDVRSINLVRLIIVFSYAINIAMILSLLILKSGVGILDQTRCKAAIVVCLVFYYGAKIGLLVHIFISIYCSQQQTYLT